MKKDLKNEIGKLERAFKVLMESNSDITRAIFYKIMVKLRVRYGYNVFGKMTFAFAYGIINEDTHHLICFAEKGIHLLYSKDVMAFYKADSIPSFKHLCYISNNKYGDRLHHYGIESVTRICFDFMSHREVFNAMDQFNSFDESEIENVLARKEKLNKINNL